MYETITMEPRFCDCLCVFDWNTNNTTWDNLEVARNNYVTESAIHVYNIEALYLPIVEDIKHYFYNF